MIYLQILTAIAGGIVLLYLGIVIVALVTMAVIRGVQRVGAFLKGRTS